jgi:hypothetical protein
MRAVFAGCGASADFCKPSYPTRDGRMTFRVAALLFAVVLFSAAPVWADSVSFTFVNGGNSNTDLGISPTFTNTSTGGVSVSLQALGFQGTPPNSTGTEHLFAKNSGSNETGLGTLDGAFHEVVGNLWLQLDMQDAVNKGFKSGVITFGSVQAGESWEIWGSNTPGNLGTGLLTGNVGLVPISIPDLNTYRYIGITAPTGSVLVVNGLTMTTPEPGTLAMLGMGLLGLCTMRRRLAL